MKNRRGAVTAILTLGTLVVIGVAALLSSVNLNKSQSTSARAACASNTCTVSASVCMPIGKKSGGLTCCGPYQTSANRSWATFAASCSNGGGAGTGSGEANPKCNSAEKKSGCTNICTSTMSQGIPLSFICDGQSDGQKPCNSQTGAGAGCTSTCTGKTSSLQYYCSSTAPSTPSTPSTPSSSSGKCGSGGAWACSMPEYDTTTCKKTGLEFNCCYKNGNRYGCVGTHCSAIGGGNLLVACSTVQTSPAEGAGEGTGNNGSTGNGTSTPIAGCKAGSGGAWKCDPAEGYSPSTCTSPGLEFDCCVTDGRRYGCVGTYCSAYNKSWIFPCARLTQAPADPGANAPSDTGGYTGCISMPAAGKCPDTKDPVTFSGVPGQQCCDKKTDPAGDTSSCTLQTCPSGKSLRQGIDGFYLNPNGKYYLEKDRCDTAREDDKLGGSAAGEYQAIMESACEDNKCTGTSQPCGNICCAYTETCKSEKIAGAVVNSCVGGQKVNPGGGLPADPVVPLPEGVGSTKVTGCSNYTCTQACTLESKKSSFSDSDIRQISKSKEGVWYGESDCGGGAVDVNGKCSCKVIIPTPSKAPGIGDDNYIKDGLLFKYYNCRKIYKHEIPLLGCELECRGNEACLADRTGISTGDAYCCQTAVH